MSTNNLSLRSCARWALLLASAAALATSFAGCADERRTEEAEAVNDPAVDQDETVSEATGALVTENIALGMPTSQSSTGWGGVSSRAVDGNTSGAYPDNSVTHTGYEANPWWQVDLLGLRSLSEVVLHNRTDCCSERLTNFNVLVSDDGSTWESFPYPGTAGAETHISLNRTGRFVKVQLAGSGYLSLAEVKVIAGSDDLALGKPTSQSSTGSEGVSSRAVDGNLSGYWPDGSITHTLEESQPWWQVDLQHVSFIGDILLANRTDCCSDRLSNFTVSVSNDGSTWQFYSHPGAAGAITSIPVNRTGRFVKVQLDGTGVLSLAEVLVRAPSANIAAGKPTSQSSTGWSGVSSRAVDGNRSGDYGQNTTTHTLNELQPWWQVDLLTDQPLREIAIYNRTDCCSERLSDFHVLVSSDGVSWTSFAHPGAASAETRMTLGTKGRYVRVQLDGTNPLSLSEVEIFRGGCEPWQETMTDGTCATLTHWATHTDLPPNSKIAIRLRYVSINYNGGKAAWKKWLGLSKPDGYTLGAVDEQLAPRDIFTTSTFRPAGEQYYDLPWFNLRAENGLYVGANDGELVANSEEQNARVFARGWWSWNPDQFAFLGVLWSERQAYLQQIKSHGGYISYCQNAFTLGGPDVIGWFSNPPNFGCSSAGEVDYFIVE